jgi:hypothetical protein
MKEDSSRKKKRNKAVSQQKPLLSHWLSAVLLDKWGLWGSL